MMPLTHAAVATAICRQSRKLGLGAWTWVLTFALSFASHYLLDAIPHFEGITPLLSYRHNALLMIGLGALGIMLSPILRRSNPETGRIWLVLTLWVALGFYAFSWWRIVTAALGIGYIAWKSPYRSAVYYVMAGMLAVIPDLIPLSFHGLTNFHRTMHYRVDWARSAYLLFSKPPAPHTWRARLHDPYFVLGYSLEILVEGAILLGSIYLLSRETFSSEKAHQSEIAEHVELSPRT